MTAEQTAKGHKDTRDLNIKEAYKDARKGPDEFKRERAKLEKKNKVLLRKNEQFELEKNDIDAMTQAMQVICKAFKLICKAWQRSREM